MSKQKKCHLNQPLRVPISQIDLDYQPGGPDIDMGDVSFVQH